ncbi:galactonate dehydratase [Alicyclobacillus fastidiosus]|uniref:Galactonate dehydratase n=1 Tax=Alicyclobacillus fastidiosus TaxID=392011 RepID=A0ABY6ZEL9_9BACL|nr:galactonate dehydratase [Alicyclobacillus fastidiosus]WAH41170.1 galactonate dehydratase [Alicyclobacillus fastidiosus]GMA62745.1 galactonate dehydratase [Alicyclobacillus fastidiosus]
MKIAKMELFLVPPRWLFLKLTTDDGLTGWGEPIVEGHAAAVAATVKEMEDYIVGQDPNRIEDIWQVLYRAGFYRGGPILMSAIAGIDQALWDLKGKRYNLPVYEFLGGRARDKVRVYSWIGGDRPADVGAAAREKRELGFTAIKMNASEEMHFIDSYVKVDEVLQRVQAVRDAVGRDFGIAVDFHGRIHKPMAKVLAKELAPFNLMFIEEPVLSENNEALREIARHTSTPIATGERMYTRWDFKNLLEDGYVDIIQPDLSHAGGISESKKIATMAEAYDVTVAPHCPLGPIALASCLQMDACTPNVFIQEQSLGIHYNKTNDLLDYLANPTVFHYENGFVALPDQPGLGIEVDEAYVRKAAEEGHNWKNPVWRNEDGTVAEW